jgi:hypothetical protein
MAILLTDGKLRYFKYLRTILQSRRGEYSNQHTLMTPYCAKPSSVLGAGLANIIESALVLERLDSCVKIRKVQDRQFYPAKACCSLPLHSHDAMQAAQLVCMMTFLHFLFFDYSEPKFTKQLRRFESKPDGVSFVKAYRHSILFVSTNQN